jgi:hypothetical protein
MLPPWVHIVHAPAFPKYFPLNHIVKKYQFNFQICTWFWTNLLSFLWRAFGQMWPQGVPSLKVGPPLPRAWKFLTVRREVKPLPYTDSLLPLLLCHHSPHFKIHYLSLTRSRHALAQMISHLPLYSGGPDSIPCQSIWHLWWNKRDRFCSKYFSFPVITIPPMIHSCSFTDHWHNLSNWWHW